MISSPRLYNTTKVIVPVVTILFQWRYADTPSRARLLGLAACGPMDDGGGGVVGDVCTQQADCVPNACCGNGTGVVNVSICWLLS